MENVTIYKIDTREAVQSINDLRQNIKTLKEEIGKLKIGSEAYKSKLSELIVNQNALKGAMNATSASFSDVEKSARAVTDSATGLGVSYNALVNQMANLRREQRNVNISTVEGQAEYDRYAQEISKVNDKLKELDSINGNYQRNVGNYASGQKEVVDNFKKLREEIKKYRSELLGLEEGTQEYDITMQKLADAQFRLRDVNETARWSANDLGERLSTMQRVTSGVVGGFTALQSAMALTVGDSEELEKMFYKLQVAASLVQGLQGFEGLTKDLPILARQMKLATAGTRTFIASLSSLKKALLATGIGALVVGLGTVVAYWQDIKEWIGLSDAEATKFIGTSERLAQQYSRETEDLDYNLKLRKAAGEEITEEEEAQERLNLLNSQYYETNEKVQRIKSGISAGYLKEKDYAEELAKLEEELKKLGEERQEAQKTYNIAQVKAETNARKEAEAQQKKTEELKKQLELIKAQNDESALNVELPEDTLDISDEVESFTENLAKADEANEKSWAVQKEINDEKLASIDKVASHEITMMSLTTEDVRTAEDRKYEITQEANAKRLALLKQFEEQAYGEGNLEAALSYQQQISDLELQIEEQTLAEKKRLREQDYQDQVRMQKMQTVLMKQSVSAVSSILGSIADIYEANSGDNVEVAEKIKGIRIAAATIDTISGALTAYTTAQSLGPIAGPIVGALNAAAVTAAGIAQIAQIRNTDISGRSTSTPSGISATVSAPSVSTEVPTVRNLTGASEEERLNRMAGDQRVYILASDIEASQNQRKVQVRESSF